VQYVVRSTDIETYPCFEQSLADDEEEPRLAVLSDAALLIFEGPLSSPQGHYCQLLFHSSLEFLSQVHRRLGAPTRLTLSWVQEGKDVRGRMMPRNWS